MSDGDYLRNLPQSPRPAQESDIVQLAPDGLTRLFRESLPTHPALSPAEARIALGMHRAGRDAAAITERVKAPLAAVMAFLDSLKPRPAEQAAAGATPAPEPAQPAGDAEPEQLEIDALPAEPSPVAAAAPPKLPPPDTELSDLQLAVIRRLRKARVPASAIALGMRLTADQVMRVAGEVP